jgi:hypothetical protein
VHSDLAIAEVQYRAARGYAHRSVEDTWQASVDGRPLSDDVRTDMLLSKVQAAHGPGGDVQMVQLAGTQAIYASSILDQLVRDAITVAHAPGRR